MLSLEGHMEVNVSQQLKSPIGTVREYEVNEKADILGIGVATPVEGQVKLTRTHRGILVQGTLKSKVPVECSRCLKVFDYPLSFDIEEEYFPVIDVNSGSHLELPDEPGSFTIDEHHILDLGEAIRQNALLAIPMKPLCKTDCAGLCASCGANLNKGKCDCEPDEIDPRWAKLAQLVAIDKKTKKKRKTE
jgi:uncharacterized protein